MEYVAEKRGFGEKVKELNPPSNSHLPEQWV